jgi:transposase-like protein
MRGGSHKKAGVAGDGDALLSYLTVEIPSLVLAIGRKCPSCPTSRQGRSRFTPAITPTFEMDIKAIHQMFPSNAHCIEYLESLQWNGKPVCPYCKRSHFTRIKGESRYHCNVCNSAYSVTVGTLFHGTKLPLQKWFLGIFEIMMASKRVTVRNLAQTLQTDKNTASKVSRNIQGSMTKNFAPFCTITDSSRSWEDEGY